MDIPLGPTQIVAGWLIIAASAWVQGSVGFGMGLISAPFLFMLDPILVPGPLIGCAVVLILLMIRRDGHTVQWRELSWPLVGRLVGVAPAIVVLRCLTGDAFSVVLGILLLLAVLMSLRGVHFQPTPRNLFVAGIISGFMGATAAAAGPAIALVYQHERGARLRGMLSWYFLIGASFTIPALYVANRFGAREIIATLILAPAAPIGYILSSRTFALVEKRALRPAVLTLSALSGVAVIIRGLI